MAEKEMKGNTCWENLIADTPDWFRDMKFGLFFHWGPYSVPGFSNEWYSRNMYLVGTPENLHHRERYGTLAEHGYREFYDRMSGNRFDPEEWADLVVRSGARYAGPVTEHADNFSMWDSRINPVNCVNYGPKRDIYGECARALRARGIRLLASFHHQWLWGWFMSTDPEADVYVPENEKYYGSALPLETGRMYPYRLPGPQFNRMWLEKVKEVTARYSPDVLYFDSRACIIAEEYRYEAVRNFYEKKGREGGVITFKGKEFPEGTGVLDVERGNFEAATPFVWQTDDRLEDNITWCYVDNPRYRSAGDVIRQLCDNVARNGSLLLNVGPDADGAFHPDAKKILYEIGGWLSVNGEAIYGTRPWKYTAESLDSILEPGYQEHNKKLNASDNNTWTFRFTQSRDGIYAIFYRWLPGSEVIIRAFSEQHCPGIKNVVLLGYEHRLTYFCGKDALSLTLPENPPCRHAWVIKISF